MMTPPQPSIYVSLSVQETSAQGCTKLLASWQQKLSSKNFLTAPIEKFLRKMLSLKIYCRAKRGKKKIDKDN